jgi:mannose-1-phosphate guanylyltransferase
MDQSVFPVIMAGGSGTRFWPLSRRQLPKQFLKLTSERPLITETLARCSDFATLENSLVVCGQRHVALVKKSIPALSSANILMEPAARNTGPAIALAALQVAKRNPKGLVVVLPSDQHVANLKAFSKAIREALALAQKGMLVTLGISPTRPETGYGYINVGTAISGTAKKVAAFAEKPNLKTAKRYLASKRYLWNAGIFVFRADVMLQAFAQYQPSSTKPLQAIFDAMNTPRYKRTLSEQFSRLEALSIDYGIAEKADNMAVVPCDCGWSDVGSFDVLSQVKPPDAQQNVSEGGPHLFIESRGNVVLGGNKMIALIGMNDVVVVDTPDALLVLPKAQSQDVKKVIEALKSNKKWSTLL